MAPFTRRFCSSQGDQTVITVPGLCLAEGTEPGACAPEADPKAAMHDCFTNTDPTLRSAADELESSGLSVARRLGLIGQAFTFLLSGGIFRAVPWLRQELAPIR